MRIHLIATICLFASVHALADELELVRVADDSRLFVLAGSASRLSRGDSTTTTIAAAGSSARANTSPAGPAFIGWATPDEHDPPQTIGEALTKQWLELFQEKAPAATANGR